jgi:hypothetical protein
VAPVAFAIPVQALAARVAELRAPEEQRRQGARAAEASVVAQASVAQALEAQASAEAALRMQRRDPAAWAVRQEGLPPARAVRPAEAIAVKRRARVV